MDGMFIIMPTPWRIFFYVPLSNRQDLKICQIHDGGFSSSWFITISWSQVPLDATKVYFLGLT